MKTPLFLLLLLALAAFTSCSKEFEVPSTPPANLSELRASPDFTWNTGKTVEIDITGLPTPEPVFSTLAIILDDGSIIYQAMHNINTNTRLSVVVPYISDSLNIRFGSNRYTLPVMSGKVVFSFIPVVQD